jgi:MFS family permease
MKTQILQKILTRDFILCFFAQFAFTSVSFILIPTLPIYLSRSGSTKVEIGVLIGAFGISSLILRPMIGRALLKIPEKTFMLAGGILFALTSMTYLIAPPFWPFFIVRIFQGIGSAFFFTAAMVLIPNITPEAYWGQSIGYFFLSFNISMALAPPFGIFLINHFGFTILFLACIVLSLISLIISSKLSGREVHLSDKTSAKSTSFISFKGFPPTFVYFFNHIIWGALTTFFPLYAINHHVTNPGLFFASYAIVMISCRALGGRILDIYSRERIILPCLSVFIISMTMLAFSKTLSMFILVAVISAIGHAFLVPTLVAYTLDLVGPDRGPGMVLLTAMGDLGMVLGPVIMGVILQLTDFTTMFMCLALSGLINFIYFYFFVKKRKKIPF